MRSAMVNKTHRLIPWREAEARAVPRICRHGGCLRPLEVVTVFEPQFPTPTSIEARDDFIILHCEQHGSVPWDRTERVKVTGRLPRRRLLVVDARLRLGEFSATHEVDVYRLRAHLALRELVMTGEPELVCGREYRYGSGGWGRRVTNGSSLQWPWTNLCPSCALVVE